MDKPYRFVPKPYQTPADKETCYSCGEPHKYRRYLDTHTGELLPEQYGWCDRVESCGYHLNPNVDGYAKEIYQQERGQRSDWKPQQRPAARPVTKPPSYIPFEQFEKSLGLYGDNCFMKFLQARFGDEAAQQASDLYFIGTSKVWKGATIFWQIDKTGQVRTGKIMLYSQLTGKRVKDPYDHFSWVHRKLENCQEYNLVQCLFGEQLLSLYPDLTVALVESEKTAIIASLFFPEYLWLATGGKENITDARLQALQGRKVILYPDLSRGGAAFTKWAEKAQRNSHLGSFIVSDFLERTATAAGKAKGLDLADYLLDPANAEYWKPSDEQQPDTAADEEAGLPQLLPAGTHRLTNKFGTTFELEINADGYPALFDTPQQEQKILATLITELDTGKPWELIYRHNRDVLPTTITADSLKDYFHSLGAAHLRQLLREQRKEFIQERFERGGYTYFGIVEHYPCFGFTNEHQVGKFLKV
jgi:hypothetical protein